MKSKKRYTNKKDSVDAGEISDLIHKAIPSLVNVGLHVEMNNADLTVRDLIFGRSLTVEEETALLNLFPELTEDEDI